VSVLAVSSPVAAGPAFIARASRTTLGPGERLCLTLTATGVDSGCLLCPRLPGLLGFSKQGASSARWSSGSPAGDSAGRQTVVFTYLLAPRRTGRLTIGPVTFDYGGRLYQTDPIEVLVTEAGGATVGTVDSAACGVMLAGSADRCSVYIGEQVTASYVLYAGSELSSLASTATPGFAGFWSVPVHEGAALDWRRAELRGRSCRSALLRRVALFPVRSGTLTLESMTLAGTAAATGGLPGAFEPFTVSSAPLNIAVRPLPDSGKPAGFSGGVGEFTLTAALSGASTEHGEPLELEVVVAGTGNIGIIPAPSVTAPAGMSLRDPKAGQETRMVDGRVTGRRTWTWQAVPRADGRHVIPGIRMSFFSPGSGRYYTLETKSLSFEATGSAGDTSAVPASRVAGSDIAHIKAGADCAAVPGGWSMTPPWWGWLWYPAGAATFIFGLMLGRHRRRMGRDRGYARRRHSNRLVRRRLAEARQLLAAGRERQFHASLSRAVSGYVGDRFNIDATGVTGEELGVELQRHGVASAVITRLAVLARDCDTGRFSPGSVECRGPELLARAEQLLADIARSSPARRGEYPTRGPTEV